MLLCLVPLFITDAVNKRFAKEVTPPLASGWVWLMAIISVVILGFVVDFFAALATLMEAGDFLVVVLRTVMFVAITRPPDLPGRPHPWLSFLTSQHLPGAHILPRGAVHPVGRLCRRYSDCTGLAVLLP